VGRPCFDSFQTLVSVESYGQTYYLRFANFYQSGWGTPAGFERSRLIGINFQVAFESQFSYEINNVQFLQ
jgi:hypothetical protein